MNDFNKTRQMNRDTWIKSWILPTLAIVIIEEILRRSHFCDFPLFESVCTVVMVLSCGLAACKIGVDLYNKKYSLRNLIFIAAGFCYTVFLVLRGQSDAFMVMWLFGAALHDVDFEKIVRVSAISMLSALLFVYVFSSAGFIDNTIKIRIREEEERNRNSMGFMEAYQPAYFLFFASLAWVYHRKERLSWYEIFTLAFLNYVVFWQSDTRSPYYLAVVLLIIVSALKLLPQLRQYQKRYTFVAVLIPIICAAIIIVQGMFISHNSSEFMRELNGRLTARLRLNFEGVHQYGISFFGQPIKWYVDNQSDHSYNWIDSVYLYSLLSYGVPFMISFFAITTKLALSAGRKRDTYMLMTLVLIAILGLWDNYCFRIECNPFYLFFAYEASINSTGLFSGDVKNEVLKKRA